MITTNLPTKPQSIAPQRVWASSYGFESRTGHQIIRARKFVFPALFVLFRHFYAQKVRSDFSVGRRVAENVYGKMRFVAMFSHYFATQNATHEVIQAKDPYGSRVEIFHALNVFVCVLGGKVCVDVVDN